MLRIDACYHHTIIYLLRAMEHASTLYGNGRACPCFPGRSSDLCNMYHPIEVCLAPLVQSRTDPPLATPLGRRSKRNPGFNNIIAPHVSASYLGNTIVPEFISNNSVYEELDKLTMHPGIEINQEQV